MRHDVLRSACAVHNNGKNITLSFETVPECKIFATINATGIFLGEELRYGNGWNSYVIFNPFYMPGCPLLERFGSTICDVTVFLCTVGFVYSYEFHWTCYMSSIIHLSYHLQAQYRCTAQRGRFNTLVTELLYLLRVLLTHLQESFSSSRHIHFVSKIVSDCHTHVALRSSCTITWTATV